MACQSHLRFNWIRISYLIVQVLAPAGSSGGGWCIRLLTLDLTWGTRTSHHSYRQWFGRQWSLTAGRLLAWGRRFLWQWYTSKTGGTKRWTNSTGCTYTQMGKNLTHWATGSLFFIGEGECTGTLLRFWATWSSSFAFLFLWKFHIRQCNRVIGRYQTV